MGRYAEGGGESVDEAGSATVSEELVHGPVHADLCLDRILWLDQEVATGLKPELKIVLDTDETVLTAALCLDKLGLLRDLVIPGVVVKALIYLVFISDRDLEGAGDGVGNPDLGATSTRFKSEADLVGWGATELEIVVLTCEQGGGEATHAALASVEGVPNVIHHGIEGVIEASFRVLEENGLNSTIPSIRVEVLEHHQANVAKLANIDLLFFEVSAAGVCTTNSGIIRDNHEVGRGLVRFRVTLELSTLEAEDDVVGGSAREISAILDIRPLRVGLFEEGPSGVVNIRECAVVEEVGRGLVRTHRVALENYGVLATHRLADEFGELATVDSVCSTPVAFAMRDMDRESRCSSWHKIFRIVVVCTRHKSELWIAIACVGSWAILRLRFAKELRILEHQLYGVRLHITTVEAETLLDIDASDVMSFLKLCLNIADNTSFLCFVRGEMTKLNASSILAARGSCISV